MVDRIIKGLWQWIAAPVRVEKPRLIMTLLVKNEEDKLEENLLFHHAMGVDGFIITDNASSDGTMAIIWKYQQKGWVLDVIEEKSTGYEQKHWVNRMILKAIKEHKADWIINADADELWYAPSGSLKAELGRSNKRVVKCYVKGMYPQEGIPFYLWDKRAVAIEEPDNYGLSRYSVFAKQKLKFKVAHRAAGYVMITMGNHRVRTIPFSSEIGSITVYHYNVGAKDAFMQKMIQGGRELETHKGKHGGRHWRYFYQLYKEGRLEEEYDKVIGRNQYDRLQKDGYIVEDRSIADFFVKHRLV